MKKAIIAGGILSLLIFAFGIAAFFSLKETKYSIPIAAIISISGPQGPSTEGIGLKNGMLLALEEINESGGVKGRRIDLIIEDAMLDPEKAQESFKRVESLHKPIIYISSHSSISKLLAPLAEEREVAMLATLATAPSITEQKEWVFRYWPTASHEVPIVSRMIKDLGINSVGILYLNDEFGRSVYALLRNDLEKAGVAVNEEFFEVLASDFSDEILRLKNNDGIFVVGFPNHLKNAFMQLKSSGFTGSILSTNAAASQFITSIPEANNVYMTAPIIYNANFIPTQSVKKGYESKFGRDFDHYAATGYDLVFLIVNLLERGEISRRGIQNLLEGGFVHPGILGTVESGSGNHDITFPMYPVQVIDNKLFYKYSH